MSVAVSADLVKPNTNEISPKKGVGVASPQVTHQQMVESVVGQVQQLEPKFTAQQAHPQAAAQSLQQNPHMQAAGAIVKDEDGFPLTVNDVFHGIESAVKSASGEPSKSRAMKALEWTKKLGKRMIGKKSAGPTQVIEVGE